MTILPEIKWYEKLDSTNNELRRQLDGLDNLSVIAAVNQTAGRGQGDHVWTSPAGENLTFSMLVIHEPGFLAKDSALINLVIGAAMREFFAEYGIEVWMKPPNDIWVGARKICGMLIENILQGREISKTIFGIGVNVNQTEFPDFLPNPVSMAQLTGKKYELDSILKRLREVIVSHLPDLRP